VEPGLIVAPATGRKVVFGPYDPGWVGLFQAESTLLRRVFGGVLVRIEHIGSTSIPGMSAKPIIDIMIEATALPEVDSLNDDMRELGYAARGEHGIPGRRYFRKGTDLNHTHHVHVYQTGNPNLLAHAAFRDYLTANPQRALDYRCLKERLAKDHADDPAAYQEGKAALAHEIVQEARAWAKGTR
jgi:GrpB-like predicted nucleotidyltransferase (UPF0157 family)